MFSRYSSSGADGLQFAACEGRFEDVGRVEAALRGAGADDGVYLVDEDDRVLGLAQRVDELLHALLELAAELGAGHQRRDVEREDRLARDGAGHVARGDAQRQPFDDGALAHARLADEDRVVLLAAREDLHHPLDLPLAPHHGVDAPFAGHAGEVRAELFEHLGRGVLLRTVRFVVIEHVYVYARLRFVAGGDEALQFRREDFGGYVVHFQYARRGRRAVGGDPDQGVGRGDAPYGAARGDQFVGEGAEERFGIVGLFACGIERLALHAQAYLIKLPILQTGGEYLAGERPFLAKDLQKEEVLERMGGARLRSVECRAGENALQRL